jgi:hypothetical protein
MATVDEAMNAKSPLAADIAAGVNMLSYNQKVTFTLYVRLVLPVDGFVFWVRADLVSPSAILNALEMNRVPYDQAPIIKVPANTVTIQGSLHYSTTRQQAEESTVAVNQVVFTALSAVQEFNIVGPNLVYIAEFGPGKQPPGIVGAEPIMFAFSQRRPFYEQADTYHYVGNAVYSTMESQIISNIGQFSQAQVVSNSLPLWLALNNFSLPYYQFQGPQAKLYPSFAVPDNLPPPYGTVHIEPNQTRALQSAPYIDQNLSHYQLTRDNVRIMFYGVRNDAALTFLDFVNEYSLNTDALGIMNMPVPRDEKQTQPELAILAMKKVIDFEVNYYQTTARNTARGLIAQAIPTYIIAPAQAA